MAEKFYILDMRPQKMVDNKSQDICVVYKGPSQIKAYLCDLLFQPLPLKKINVLEWDEIIFNKLLEYNKSGSIYMTAAAQRDIANILSYHSKNTKGLILGDGRERLFSRIDSDKMKVSLKAQPISLAFVDLATEET
jgi:hypothetical protein